MRLKGESSAAFRASNSATVFCFTGAGGAVLGRGGGNMFTPSWTHKKTQRTTVRTQRRSNTFA